MDNTQIDLEELINDVPDDSELRRVRHLCSLAHKEHKRVEALEKELKLAKETLRSYTDEEIPAAMAEAGMTQLTLDNGVEIKVKDVIRGSIRKDREQEAFEWLEESGNGDLIKHTIVVQFGRGEDEKARDVLDMLLEQGYQPSDTKKVHPQTLAAWAREQIEQGNEIPYELLGIYVGKTTKLTGE